MTLKKDPRQRWSDTTLIVGLAILSRLFTLSLLSILSYLQPFDSSHLLTSSNSPTLRWDALHFSTIAVEGYEYEQQLAFQPGWPGVMHLAGRFLTFGKQPGLHEVVWGGVFVGNAAFVGASVMLYKLTAYLINPSFALTSTLLYLIQPATAIMSSPYTEPLYALFTFSGVHMIVKRRWYLAGLLLGGATSMRATGVFAAGILGWMMLFEHAGDQTPRRELLNITRRGFQAIIPCTLVVLPFIAFQVYAYVSFCRPEPAQPWCHRTLPIAYTHVQAKYWNVGFLNYWTIDQLPNLLIATPILLISLTGSYAYLTEPPAKRSTALTAIHIHHLFLTFLLIFSSHTQIALRLASGDPVIWWNVASMAFPKGHNGRMSKWGTVWVWWSVIWGGVSLVLWAGHYPPA